MKTVVGRLLLPVNWLLLCTLGISGCVPDSGNNDWLNTLLLDVAPVDTPLYLEECGACHFAYQAGLLNADSWSLVMDGLEDHFGDNAELDEESNLLLRRYLLDNAADRSEYIRSQGIAMSQRVQLATLRVSETPYFLRKHNELPLEQVTGNPEVGSFSHCDKCHKEPGSGSFNGEDVRIPGRGKGED
ncbi:MAG: cytochrome C [Sedimenticola sp.]